MHGTNSISFLLLWAFCSLVDLQIGVSAEPTVTATIFTPEADRKEGGQVYMQCVARNLNSNHLVEWRTEDPERTLRWGSANGSHPSRFWFMTVDLGNGKTIQTLTINSLQRGDTDEYVCNVHQIFTYGGSIILATARVTLSVLYFPSESFPMCYPNGPFTKRTGTELTLQCSSEIGNPTITMTVSEYATRCDTYTWKESNINGQIVMSLSQTLAATDDKTTFECTISSAYYPNMTRSCTIGPINVISPTVPPAKCSTRTTPRDLLQETTSQLSTHPDTSTVAGQLPDNATTLIAVLCISLCLLAVAVIIIIILIFKYRHLKTLLDEKNNLPKADLYMELQLTGDRNRDYMEPERQLQRGTTTMQHTYFETLGIENDEPEEGYEKPNAERKYEAIVQPQP